LDDASIPSRDDIIGSDWIENNMRTFYPQDARGLRQLPVVASHYAKRDILAFNVDVENGGYD
jgi:hypothetical protein